MNNWQKILMLGAMCSCAWSIPAAASTNLETGSSLAGISVALNNYYAGTTEPEQKLADSYRDMENQAAASGSSGGAAAGSGQSAGGRSGENSQGAGNSAQAVQGGSGGGQAAAQKPKTSAYDNIAVSKVSGSVNIRTEANTNSNVTGKIYNDCAATILDTVEGEGGKWYKIQSGSVTGYIKAEYFVTGEKAEAKAKEVGTTYGTVVDTPSLRLRENPDLTSKTLTLLAEGAHYTVLEEQGDFLKVAVDTDLEGYVFKDYMKTNVEFKKAVSLEEEQAKEAADAKRKEEAEKALKELEEAKKAQAAKKTTAATTAAEKKTEAATTASTKAANTEAVIQTIAANPENGNSATVAAPQTEGATEKPTEKPTEKETVQITEKPTENNSKGPGSPDSGSGNSSEVTAATRNAIVAYAKQFLGNPYVYGGTSLTNGADCSGFVMSVYSHFGISTGRSSRDQAAKGKAIPVSDVKPGDLLFYASGNYINHVGIYIGGGQIIHASTPATGICYAPSNYRTPCKAVTFLD